MFLVFFYDKEVEVEEDPPIIDDEPEYVEDDESKYKISSNATEYQITLNDELNELVETEGYDEKVLAQLIAKNFIAEFYTLSNVNSRSPGGLQFVPVELKERFEEFASDIYDFYSYYDNRDELIVSDITITNTKSITYTYDDDLNQIATKKNLSGYEITMTWKYDTVNTTKLKVIKWNDEYGIVSVQN